MDTVLVVCTANICRSPLMEALLRRDLDPARFQVESSGTLARPGHRVDSMVRLEMARLGVDPSGLVSRPLRESHVAAASLVLTATKDHRSAILQREPLALHRTFTVLELAALLRAGVGEGAADLAALGSEAARRRSLAGARIDVPDPIGRSPQVHRQVADMIADATATVAGALNAVGTSSARP